MNKDILVIYHANCDDGMGAALAAYMKFGDTAEYVSAQYGKPIPNLEGKDVYIFDFSYPKEILLDTSLNAKSITMLDHHKTAIESWGMELYADITRNILIRFDMKKSGAMLAWDYFFPDTIPPMIIQHVQDSDLWLFHMPDTKVFIRNLRSYPQEIHNWVGIMELTADPDDYETFIQEGKAQERFFNAQIKTILTSSKVIPIHIGGIEGDAINASVTFSNEMAEEMAKKNGSFGIVYSLEEGMVRCSVRSLKGGVDVSQLCQLYGGGGHQSSAGMRISIKTFLEEILCSKIQVLCQE